MKQYIKMTVTVLLIAVLAALGLAACGDCKHEDTYWRVDIEPTCLVAGTRTKVCEVCAAELETEQFSGSHTYEEGVCTACGVAQYGTKYMQYRAITLNGEEGYEIVDLGNCGEAFLKIPAIHNNKPVLAIAKEAFYRKLSLKSVHISQNIAVIGDRAFADCTALEEVTFAEESELLSLGSGVFAGCEKIEHIEIPSGVTTLSDGLFEDCLALTEVVVHDGLLSLGDDVFAGCIITPTLVENGVAYLGTEANPYLVLLQLTDKTKTALSVPEGTVIIAPYAMSGASLESVQLPTTLREICGSAFEACRQLAAPTLPASLVRIGKNAFAACSSMTAIELPEGLVHIGTGAFRNATQLAHVSVPSSVRSVGALAFLNCAEGLYLTENGVSYVGNAQNPHLVLVKADTSLASVEIHASTLVIADSAFNGTKITSVTIPTSVVVIGNNAFTSCSSLVEVVFATQEGWQRSISFGAAEASDVDVSDAAANATAMTGVHRDSYLFRTAE